MTRCGSPPSATTRALVARAVFTLALRLAGEYRACHHRPVVSTQGALGSCLCRPVYGMQFIRPTRASACCAASLERPRIFHTGWFHERYEDAARRNLARSLEGHVQPVSRYARRTGGTDATHHLGGDRLPVRTSRRGLDRRAPEAADGWQPDLGGARERLHRAHPREGRRAGEHPLAQPGRGGAGPRSTPSARPGASAGRSTASRSSSRTTSRARTGCRPPLARSR